jgi:glycine/D-amino acid oxidase-like deaminating enzyme
MRIVVIGAGIIGANVAWRLTQKGAKVTVVEAGRPGSGTSGNSFAWVNSHRKPPRRYHDLNVLAMHAHRALCREFPDQNWWGGRGSVAFRRIDESVSDFEAQIATWHDWNYGAEVIDRKRLAALLPDIDANAFPDHQAVFFEDEGWVSPVLLVHRLIQAAKGAGAEVLTESGPVTVVLKGGAAKGVRIAAGEIEADAVVNCAGRLVNSVIDDGALHIPMDPTLGMLVFTPPIPVNPDLAILGPECEIRPDGAGRMMLHSEEIDHRLTPDLSPEQLRQMATEAVERATRIIPSIANAQVEAFRIGTRARPVDGYPAVGSLPGLDGYTVVATHSGVTLSPWLGQAVADEILDGKVHEELSDFRPRRFFGASAPAAQPWVRD